MIENLNRRTFSPFGTILNRGLPQGDDRVESVHYFSAENLCFYRCAAPVCLDYELGMTVLVVRADRKVTYFYLDKAVCLNEGQEFAVVPYQSECSVRLSVPVGASLRPLDAVASLDGQKITDRLLLGSIYTLFYREEEQGFLFKGEKHSMFELTYVDRGQLHCVVEGNGYLLKQGQMMLFAPEQWHMQYTDLDTSARFLTVSFDLDGQAALLPSDRVIDLSSQEAALLSNLVRECERSDALSSDYIRCDLKLLLLSVLRGSGKQKKRLKTPVALRNENLIVSRTLQFIADHVYDRLSVETVSKEVGVSTSHLTALFHRQMGISPGEYIRRVKLEESKVLIREGRLNFSQIAAELNYSTIHHFSRQFKDNFGISPSEYSKSIRSE